jgi:hypothetical protein
MKIDDLDLQALARGQQISLEDLVHHSSRIAEWLFERQGAIAMFWLVDIPGEGLRVMPPPEEDDQGDMDTAERKDRHVASLREFLWACGATRYALASEAWSVLLTDRDELKRYHGEWKGSLANAPHRVEVISIQAEDGRELITASREIVRPAQGKPYLAKLEIERPDLAEGRFVNLLPRHAGDEH